MLIILLNEDNEVETSQEAKPTKISIKTLMWMQLQRKILS